MANSVGQAFRDPLFLADSAVTYTADEFRNVIDALSTPGRRDAQSLLVTQHAGTPNMSVDVSPGTVIVPGTTSGAPVDEVYPQGLYIAKLDTACSITIPTAPGSGSRTDNIYVQIADKTVVGSGNNEAIIKIQSPASSLPVSSLLLATVVVTAGQTQIFNAAIAPNTTYAAPPSQAGAIASAEQRSLAQGWYWGGLTGYGPWPTPADNSSAWFPAPGAAKTLTLIQGHWYRFTSQLNVRCENNVQTSFRVALFVDNIEYMETYGQTDSVSSAVGGGVNVPVSLWVNYYCTVGGSHTFDTRFNSIQARIFNPFFSPTSDCIDMGPLAG